MKAARIVLMVAVAVLLVVGPAVKRPVAMAQPAGDALEVTQGTLKVNVKPGQKLLEFPLGHTDVAADIAGMVAHVTVTQRFGNPYEEPVEAVYVLPLPQNAAVNDMVMKVGDRTIRAVIKKRDEAKEIYEEAKREGKRASLLEQERPNIFTQSVANILPGDTILITIRYVQDLTYDHGSYEFVFPMVVGPRFIPGAPLDGPPTGGGWAPDTTRVPDASRITPPVLRPDERSGHDIGVKVSLDAGIPISHLRSKSHDVTIEKLGPKRAAVQLKPSDSIPNKDFILEYDVAGKQPEAGLLSYWGDGGGFFTLILQPKADFEPAEITPKEMIFVMDCSGSMRGYPIEKAKEAVRRCLKGMNEGDSFQIIRFSISASRFSPRPLPNTPENVERGLKYIDELKGQGGTQMIEGIKAALDYPPDPKRMRIVLFMTDGYIGNETEILAAIEERLGGARLFSYGVGSSVNRYLMDRMAEAGRGTVQYVRPDEDTEESVDRFYDRIARPYLTDLEIDWGGLKVGDVYPKRIPDLFAAQPVILHGCYTKGGRGTVTMRGQLVSEPWETVLRVTLPGKEHGNEGLASLWARTRIKELMSQMHRGEKPEIVERITNLALEFRLMSAYTSFVAVEEKVVTEGGKTRTVQVPVPMPESVSYEGVFGPVTGDRAVGFSHFGGARVMAGAAYAPLQGLARGRPGMSSDALRRAPVAAAPVFALRAEGAEEEDEEGEVSFYLAAWLCRVQYRDGDWSVNGRALTGLLDEAARVVGLPAGGKAAIPLLTLSRLPEEAPLRCLFLTGSSAITLSDEEIAALGKYLAEGGFIIVDSAGDAFYRSVVEALRKALPRAKIEELPADHPIYRGKGMPYSLPNGCPTVTQLGTAGPARGVLLNGQLVGFISRGDLGSAWSGERTAESEAAFRMGINLLSYALQREGHVE